MAQLLSSWYKGVQTLPKEYVLPPEKRPGDFIEVCKEIPVIDLQTNRSELVQQVLKACQEFGLFQVINHGVSDKSMMDMNDLYHEFFNMTSERKLGEGYKLFTSGMHYDKEEIHFWKDSLQHPCHPLEEHISSWPDKPARYREEVGKYVLEVRKVAFEILHLIGAGLGLDPECFHGPLTEDHGLVVHRYPPCPDPSLAMGLARHNDISLITLLQQDHYGLQIEKDGKWMGVEPIPNAFVINFGCPLEILSNGKLKSVEHRVVLNSTAGRTSICTFLGPNRSIPVVIEPAKELVTPSTPQAFKPCEYKDFLANYFAYMSKPFPRDGTVLDVYRM